MKQSLAYFRWPFALTVIGLALVFVLGWNTTHSIGKSLAYVVIGAVLIILEISLSFDNAIVNANKLRTMPPLWQRRFLTWGIVIAVFGMRIVFPLVIVAIAAGVGPLDALYLAIERPHEYARLVGGAHLSIAGFGGAFLLMVALNYFIDEGKDVDWIRALEVQLRRCASIRGLQITMVLLIILAVTLVLPGKDKTTFLSAAILGLVAFTAVEALSHLLDSQSSGAEVARTAGLGGFLYLEVLDASFSFDGVIGAFALTQDFFLIAIGLRVARGESAAL